MWSNADRSAAAALYRLLAAIIIAFAVLVFWFVVIGSQSDRRAFDRRLAAWHRRCDAHIPEANSTPQGQSCLRELDELLAYAKSKGWTSSR